MIYGGIDAGSRTIKAVLFDAGNDTILAAAVRDQGVEQEALARQLFDELLEGVDGRYGDIGRIVATGYGRKLIHFADATVTEITCHARGVRHLNSCVRTIIEIGGQDSKLIRFNDRGEVHDFKMNDRCAAGTGRFLEMLATCLGVRLQELDALARQCRNPAAISSMCVVFAETEIVGLLASGVPPGEIVAGVFASIARRVASMAGKKVEGPVFFVGGVALIPAMADALTTALGQPVRIVPEPQMTGALGAAVHAARG